MSSETAEKGLVNVIGSIVYYERQIEKVRLEIAKTADFNPFVYFRSLDRDTKGFLDELDFADFLTKCDIKPNENDLKQIFYIPASRAGRLTYNDFLQYVLPQTDNKLKEQCLSRANGRNNAPKNEQTSSAIDALVGDLFKKEFAFEALFKRARDSLPKVNLSTVFRLIDPKDSGNADFVNVTEFMLRNQKKFSETDYSALLRRIDKTQSGIISFLDFRNFITATQGDYLTRNAHSYIPVSQPTRTPEKPTATEQKDTPNTPENPPVQISSAYKGNPRHSVEPNTNILEFFLKPENDEPTSESKKYVSELKSPHIYDNADVKKVASFDRFLMPAGSEEVSRPQPDITDSVHKMRVVAVAEEARYSPQNTRTRQDRLSSKPEREPKPLNTQPADPRQNLFEKFTNTEVEPKRSRSPIAEVQPKKSRSPVVEMEPKRSTNADALLERLRNKKTSPNPKTSPTFTSTRDAKTPLREPTLGSYTKPFTEELKTSSRDLPTLSENYINSLINKYDFGEYAQTMSRYSHVGPAPVSNRQQAAITEPSSHIFTSSVSAPKNLSTVAEQRANPLGTSYKSSPNITQTLSKPLYSEYKSKVSDYDPSSTFKDRHADDLIAKYSRNRKPANQPPSYQPSVPISTQHTPSYQPSVPISTQHTPSYQPSVPISTQHTPTYQPPSLKPSAPVSIQHSPPASILGSKYNFFPSSSMGANLPLRSFQASSNRPYEPKSSYYGENPAASAFYEPPKTFYQAPSLLDTTKSNHPIEVEPIQSFTPFEPKNIPYESNHVPLHYSGHIQLQEKRGYNWGAPVPRVAYERPQDFNESHLPLHAKQNGFYQSNEQIHAPELQPPSQFGETLQVSPHMYSQVKQTNVAQPLREVHTVQLSGVPVQHVPQAPTQEEHPTSSYLPSEQPASGWGNVSQASSFKPSDTRAESVGVARLREKYKGLLSNSTLEPQVQHPEPQRALDNTALHPMVQTPVESVVNANEVKNTVVKEYNFDNADFATTWNRPQDEDVNSDESFDFN